MRSPMIEMIETIETIERIVYLRTQPALRDLPRQALELVSVSARECHFRRGDTLAVEGEICTRAHFIVDGGVLIEKTGRPVGFRSARGSVGWLDTLAGAEAGQTARVTRDTLTLCFDHDAVADLCEDPTHGFAILHASLRTICTEICRAVAAAPVSTTAVSIVPEALPGWRPDDRDAFDPGDWVERMLHLRALPLFRNANLDGIAALARGLQPTHVEAREPLWPPGEPLDGPVHVVAGRVSCRREACLQGFGPGTLLGLPQALARLAHEGTVVADTPVLALRGNTEHLLDVIEDNPDIGLQVLSALARQRLDLLDGGPSGAG